MFKLDNGNNINNFAKKRILISPLDWGLGHATRCIPIIQFLEKYNTEIFIAAEHDVKNLLQREFPEIVFIDFKGYRIKYNKNGNFKSKILSQIPSIIRSIKNENYVLKSIVKKYNIDIIISDNRYGFRNENCYNIFITHQLEILTGNRFLNKIIQKINYYFINKFDECWIADVPEFPGLAGKLSHPKAFPRISFKYTGILSRFKKRVTDISINFLFIISGPEPQRTIFENELKRIAANLHGEKVFILGKPGVLNKTSDEINHAEAEDLNRLINSSEIVICRSGYSSIMDLISCEKKALLHPTLGQTEQEYLAELHNGKNGFLHLKNLNELKSKIIELQNLPAAKSYTNNLEILVHELMIDVN